MWLGGSHSRFQFLLSHFAPLLAPEAEPSQDRLRASSLHPPPAPPSSLSPAPSDPPLPQGRVWEVRISAEFSRRVSELVFLQLPAPPAEPPSPLRSARPLHPGRAGGAAGSRSALQPARPPRYHRPRVRRTAACGPRGAAEPGRRQQQSAAPPGRSAPPADSGEPMVPATATCSHHRRRACPPGAELSPARSRGRAD